jgi:hypothetical protein
MLGGVHLQKHRRAATGRGARLTNNPGGRAVRMPKVKQKIADCLRTVTGAGNFCVLRSGPGITFVADYQR